MTAQLKLIFVEIDRYNNLFAEYSVLDDNNVEIGKHRESFYPGQDLSEKNVAIKLAAEYHWTPEVITAYRIAQDDSTNI